MFVVVDREGLVTRVDFDVPSRPHFYDESLEADPDRPYDTADLLTVRPQASHLQSSAHPSRRRTLMR